ncbi:hypothetical protein [Neglectibacter timonensis]|uniref:hypothetical protein n=1 Tax=Neglectibacter timonensis TaxID=1776382 RepID=UPI003AB3BEE2
MDLVQGRSARQRNDFVLRLGCWMVTLSMVCSLVIQPPKAKAIAIADDAVVAAVILSVMAYGGYKLWVDNLDASAIADIIKPHVKQWNYEHGSSAEDPFSGFAEWATGGMDKFRKSITPIPGGPGPDMNGISWVLSFALFDKVCQFAEWLGNRVGAKPGVAEPVPIAPSASSDITARLFSAWDDYNVEHFNSHAEKYDYMISAFSSAFSGKTSYCLYMSSVPISIVHSNSPIDDGKYSHKAGFYLYTPFDYTPNEQRAVFSVSFDSNFKFYSSESFTFYRDYHYKFLLPPDVDVTVYGGAASVPSATLALPGTWSPSVPAEGTETVPMVIPGAMPAEVLDVDALVQEILNRVTKNELVVQPSGFPAPDPGTQPDEQAPDLDSLGLPALGAALTSRFPFSIPWDVVRGIKLLAAPAEAPYWEVDFLAPIAGRVGGWKGSTKVVIDMGQYEIIGQLCRWTSTIGFCLVLAAGTKKLIWTA